MKYVVGGVIVGALLVYGFFSDTPLSISEPAGSEVSAITPTGVVHQVVVTPDGYEPRELDIALGDAIAFSASDDYGRPHWPASNIHPTHDIYPEFDPLEPVPPETTWSFVFDERGEWKFHDHITPYHTGVVRVK